MSEEIENKKTEVVVDATEQPKPVEVTEEPKPVEATEEPKPVEAIEEPKPVEEKKLEKKKKEKPVPGDFDWDAIDAKIEIYTPEEKSKLESAYDKTLKQINEHEVQDGIVVGLSAREVVINIGYKSDAIIPRNEVRYREDLAVGDTVEVYVETLEGATGQLELSHKKARTLRSWEKINVAHEKDEIIQGYVKWRTKGGLVVDIFGIEAFLPGSQIDVKPIRDYDIYVGKTMEFKVVKINHEYKNVVVSHKALIEDELEAQRAEIIASLEKGQVLEGLVKNITSYGVFIDLGGVDGLIHITDLSWGRIKHPEEIVQLDEKIKVVILDFDENKKRIALGLKQLTPHPWERLDENIKVGDKVKGRVVVTQDYGAFIEIAPGVEGLIHVSEMSWSQHLRSTQDFLKEGSEIEAVILTLDREDRKMSLGIKQLIPDPWTGIVTKYPVASKHSAIVRNFTNFGIFVELEEGVDGLIHISDLSWSKKIKHPAEFTNISDKIDVVVLEIDADNRRLSLGHKQLEENPWDVFESVFAVGTLHKGTILSANDKGAIVSLPYGVEGFAPNRHLRKENGQQAQVEESMDFKVIEFNKDNKKIILSHSRIHEDVAFAERNKDAKYKAKEAASTSKAVRKIKDNIERTTLGDLGTLANLKQQMLESEKAKLEEMTKKAEKAEKAKLEEKAKKAKKAKSEEVAEKATSEEVAEKATSEEVAEKATSEEVAEKAISEKVAKKAKSEEVAEKATSEEVAEKTETKDKE